MSSRRFWVMEGQIFRIQAANDIRQLQLLGSAQSGPEALNKLSDSLATQMGELYRIKREKFIAPEEGVESKFKALAK